MMNITLINQAENEFQKYKSFKNPNPIFSNSYPLKKQKRKSKPYEHMLMKNTDIRPSFENNPVKTALVPLSYENETYEKQPRQFFLFSRTIHAKPVNNSKSTTTRLKKVSEFHTLFWLFIGDKNSHLVWCLYRN